MKKYTISLILILMFTGPLLSQPNSKDILSFKTFQLLKNNTYEVKEFTHDSVLLYKGILSSKDPEIRHGRYYFFNQQGRLDVIGYYNQDYPYGSWVYLDDNNDTINAINYANTWNYLETDALDYSIDSSVLNSLKAKDKKTMNPDGTFYLVNKMPTFNNEDPSVEFTNYIRNNVLYPAYAEKKGISGKVVVQFMIDENGYVRNPIVVQSVSPDLDLEAIRVISESPRWLPGKQKKQPVNVIFEWPLDFYPYESSGIHSVVTEIFESEPAFLIDLSSNDVDQFPLFRGKDWFDGFREFTIHNLDYPENAAENGVSGRVMVGFSIMPDGSIDSINIIKSVSPDLDAEAVRVINKSRKEWTSGTKNGENVETKLKFPFNFVLQ
jgi:TonB family protein